MTEAQAQMRLVQDEVDRQPFHLELVRSSRGFERLFEGFDSVRAITYVARAQNVLDFFSQGYNDDNRENLFIQTLPRTV